MRSGAQRGFTLVELMTVVAIIAVLTTLAAVSVRSGAKPVDVATRFAAFVESASRIAVRDGVLAAATITSEGSKRRSRITAGGTPLVFTLEVLKETPSVQWEVVETFAVPTSVTAAGFVAQVGTYSVLSASPGIDTDWTAFDVSCYPSGSCTAVTIFFSSNTGMTMDRQARVSVLPLGAATYIKSAWD